MTNVNLGSEDDQLRATAGEENSVAGNGGDDLIRGRGKSDLLLGGQGNDTLFGANGHDDLFGGGGDDVLNGGNGRDTLQGDKGNNTLIGGNGDDTFVINANLAGQGYDVIEDFDVGRELRQMTFNDKIEIKNAEGKEINLEQTADGDVILSVDGTAMATIKGSEGNALTAEDIAAVMTFDGQPASLTTKIVGSNDSGDVLSGPDGYENFIIGLGGDDDITGGNQADDLNGNQGSDTIHGSLGDDLIKGGADNDRVYGDNGNDTVNGDKGDDFVFGGRGADELNGGDGADTFYFRPNNLGGGDDVITDFDAAEGDVIQLHNFAEMDTDLSYDGTDTKITYEGNAFVTVENVELTSADFGDEILFT